MLPRLVTPLERPALRGRITVVSAGLPRPEFSDDVAVTVVLASEGYPEQPITGRPITGLADVEGVTVAHAATALVKGEFVATGRPAC